MRELFELSSIDRALEYGFILGSSHIHISDRLYGTSEESSCSTRWIKYLVSENRSCHIYYKLCDCSGSVVFSCISGTLEIFEYLFIDIIEYMELCLLGEVYLIDLVHYLSDEYS
jgi:hypothetical protein